MTGNYEPDQLQVRIIISDDGNEKIQMRIDLGMVQMEILGRPDGHARKGSRRCWILTKPRRSMRLDTGTPFHSARKIAHC